MGKRAGQGEAKGVFGATRGLAAENTEMAPLGSTPRTRVRVGATAVGLDGGQGIWGVLKPSGSKGRATLWHRAENPVNLNAKDVPAYKIQDTLEAAWERGHDAMRITNYIRPGGTEPETIIVVRHPNQLRRPTAKFNPARRDSSDLLAGIAGGAGLGGSFIPDRGE